MDSPKYENDNHSEPYVFQGLILPERAQLSLEVHFRFEHIGLKAEGEIKINIILNQVTAWVYTDHDWDIFDLRNTVKTALQDYVSMVGYLKGLAFDIQVNRVFNQSRSIDYVFGIDTPCIAERNKDIDIGAAVFSLRSKTIGENGIFLSRAFSDLTSALKHADDTGFYCYRAIESLVHHCSATYELKSAKKTSRWKKFRDVSSVSEQICREIQEAARSLRHGEFASINSTDRAALLLKTWSVVDAYLTSLPDISFDGSPR